MNVHILKQVLETELVGLDFLDGSCRWTEEIFVDLDQLQEEVLV